jgi:arylsulfatase A-like enzyme
MSYEHSHNTINEFGFDHYQTWQIFDDKGKKTTRYWMPHQNRDGNVIADQMKDRYGPDVDLEFHLDFIRTNAEAKTPFLAYYATCLPHFPWEPTPDSKDTSYREKTIGKKGDPKYFPAMVAYLDKQVGIMMRTLEDLGIADNTIVIFLADNGTDRDLVNLWGDGKKVQGGKGTMTDRGTHVPLFVRWPGHIKHGATCGDLIDFCDLFPRCVNWPEPHCLKRRFTDAASRPNSSDNPVIPGSGFTPSTRVPETLETATTCWTTRTSSGGSSNCGRTRPGLTKTRTPRRKAMPENRCGRHWTPWENASSAKCVGGFQVRD